MSASYRLADGGRIDRSRPIVIRFNGREVPAFEGDTAASALLASGIHFVGRSFKYHRPRGILSHGSEEPNALLDVDRGANRRDPNNRATVVEAFDGLVLRSQNHWPTLALDVGEINDALGAVFVSGFYYKTFMWPKPFWKDVYEPVIRAAAGLGKAPVVPDPERYTQRHAHAEILVVGSGPAGLVGGAGGVARCHQARHPVRRAGRVRRQPAARHHEPNRRHAGASLARSGTCNPARPSERDAARPHHGVRLFQS